MAKFFFFEYIVQMFYSHVFTKPKDTYGKGTQLGVTFASGYLAGVVCAIVSHPADSVVSLMGKPSNKGKGIGQIASEVGIVSLATKGLGTRVLMIGTLTGSYTPPPCLYSSRSDRDYRLPVVDLRHLQDLHGHGHDRWKVSVCGQRLIYSSDLSISLSYPYDLCRCVIDSSRTYPVEFAVLWPVCVYEARSCRDVAHPFGRRCCDVIDVCVCINCGRRLNATMNLIRVLQHGRAFEGVQNF